MKRFFQMLMIVIVAAGLAVTATAEERSLTEADGSTETDELTTDTDIHPGSSSRKDGIKVEFELLDREGKHITQENFLDKQVLLTFGYTHCEHICPMILSNMARTLKASGNGSVGVFISVDSERDSPAITDDYATGFNSRITGLSGSYDKITAAAKNFKVSYSVTKTPNHYVVQHSTDIFLIGPDGRLQDVFTFNSLPRKLD